MAVYNRLKLSAALSIAALVMAQGVVPKIARATGDTWTANSASNNNWNSAGAWTGNNPPQDGDDLYFDGSGYATSNNNITDLSINTISFRGNISYILTGNSLTLNGGLYIQTNNPSIVETINLAEIDGQYIQFGTGGSGGYSNGNLTFEGGGKTFNFDADTGLWAQGQTGTATINVGNNTLAFSGGAWIGSENSKNNVTLDISGSSGGNVSFGDVINLGKYGTLKFTGAQTSTLSGALSGGGNLIQSGSGVTILSETNDYTGATTVNGGVLDVTGMISASNITQSGGTLCGPGGSVQSVILNSGVLQAHDATHSTGNLAIKSLTTNSGKILINVGSSSKVDVINVISAAPLGHGTTLMLNLLPLALPTPGENVLILSSTSLTNNLPGFINGVGPTTVAGHIALTPYVGGSKPGGGITNDANIQTNPNDIYLYVSGG
jgi:autotransporter-associated beta strand protein